MILDSLTSDEIDFLTHYLINDVGQARKYEYNEDYFELVNTPDKAYWLGWLMSDGSISTEGWVITLGITDKHIIEDFKKCLNADIPIRTRIHKIWKPQYRLNICSKKMVNDLAKYGVVPNKTFRMKCPDLSLELMSHFYRGYFEGDGCLHFNKKTRICYFSITSSSIPILVGIETYLKNLNLINKKQGHVKISKNKRYGVFVVNKRAEMLKTLELLYQNAHIKLDRKYNLFLRFKNEFLPLESKSRNKYWGVIYHPLAPNKKWRAILHYKKLSYNLQYHNTAEEAALAYNKKADELGIRPERRNII